MSRRLPRVRIWLLVVVTALVTCLFLIGRARLSIDSDIVASLPAGDPILSDARSVLRHHPMQERVAIDLAQPGTDPAALLAAAAFVEKRLQTSGLFRSVGLDREQQQFPALVLHVTDHLPELFDARQLERDVLPRLTPDAIHRALVDAHAQLTSLDSIGQAHLLARDPLGLRNLILARLGAMAPSSDAVLIQGHLFSSDRKHLLLLAEPTASAYDTTFSRKLTATLAGIAKDLEAEGPFVLTPVGAYRAALDNETTIQNDTTWAVVVSTIAIALLLLLGFRRPWIGLLALIPALAGTMVAVFVYSLIEPTISLLAIGFGGAVISFTVDYGIAYLLFLDQPRETRGLDVTREIWSIGLLAMLTTAVSFAFLFVAGFRALSQLGLFAALGVAFTYIFVHGVYPFLIPTVPPARRTGSVLLQRLVDRLACGGWRAAIPVAMVGVMMLAFAKPDFQVDIESMNTVSPDTLRAEHTVQRAFGNVLAAVSLAVQADSAEELQDRSDALANALDLESDAGTVASAFVPSMIFPGKARTRRNQAAWHAFFTSSERAANLRRTVEAVSEELGFAPKAFEDFLRTTETTETSPPVPIPAELMPLLGIGANPSGHGLQLYATVRPGPHYDGEQFYAHIGEAGLAQVFDPSLFSARLGKHILRGFLQVAAIVGCMTLLVSALYLVHARLTAIAILPTVFSLVCTVGTLRLMGRPLGIPVIMVCAVVIGMGSDYALYLVRAYQRYQDETHPSLGLIRLSTFLSFATTFVGFGVLAFAEHSVLTSAGTALALGIGYSYLGTITLVPPLARYVLTRPDHATRTRTRASANINARVRLRYRNLEAYPRLFARFKLACDPMFPRLADFVVRPRVILDVGTGFGVPAAFLLERFADARIFGIDPDPDRCEIAAHALHGQATISVDRAPNVPRAPDKADTALLLDIAHYLDDACLDLTLRNLHAAMCTGGRLVVRATVPGTASPPRERRVEQLRLRIANQRSYYRSRASLEAALQAAGFRIALVEAPTGREETWFVADAQ